MCARYTLTIPSFTVLARALEVKPDPEMARQYQPRYNVAPSDTQVVLRVKDAKREIVHASWGLVNHWAKNMDARQINARSESVREKPMFKEAFARRRCIVPADGFYEWKGPKGKKRPIWFHAATSDHHGLLYFAGLYESWTNPKTEERIRTFAILTTNANDVVAPVHDRMPVILNPQDVSLWLGGETGHVNPEQLEALLRPCSSQMLASRAVSTRVNSVKVDDSSLVEEVQETVQGTLPLFQKGMGNRE